MANPDTTNLCDCERSHNGFGMAGRECDCPAGRRVRIPCEACQREGRILRASAVRPGEEIDLGVCPECDGTAYITVESAPATMEDVNSNG